MTDYTPDDYDSDDDEDESSDGNTVTLARKQIRSMERDAKQARKATEENQRLLRELAFVKAGIDPDDPKLKYFVKGYEGEITAEAIRAAAEADGFLTAMTTNNDATAQDRLSNASAGATHSAPPTTPDGIEAQQIEELREADRTGGKAAVLAKIREHGHNIV